jgi:hypothetical protein
MPRFRELKTYAKTTPPYSDEDVQEMDFAVLMTEWLGLMREGSPADASDSDAYFERLNAIEDEMSERCPPLERD